MFLVSFFNGIAQNTDSLLAVPLKINSSSLEIEFRKEIRISIFNKDKIINWLKNSENIIVYESEISIKANCKTVIKVGKRRKKFPVQMFYTLEIVKTGNVIECTVHQIYYRPMPDSKDSWLTNAEEAIADNLLCKKNNKINKLRASYKIQTLIFIDNLFEKIEKLLL